MKDLNIVQYMMWISYIFVLISVERDAFLLFVCLFVCYLYPLAEPNWRNGWWLVIVDGW